MILVNANGQVNLNTIQYINNLDDTITYLECIQIQALMDSDDADSFSMIDLIGDLDFLENAIGGTIDLYKFAATIMRVPTEIGTETIDMALNPALTAARGSMGWATAGKNAKPGQRIDSLSVRMKNYWSFKAQKAVANKFGYRSAAQFNKFSGTTATQKLAELTGYKATGNAYRSTMALKNAYNIVKYGKTGANLIKGVPYLGTALDIGMIGATWKHSDVIAKSGGITGAAMGIGGIIAAPFTFGASLTLSIGGAAIGAGTSFA